jgi:hypothetical protein
MTGALVRIAERRAILVARAETQRRSLARAINPWGRRLALADRALAVFRFIRGHPAWMIGGFVLLATGRGGRGVKWLQRSWLTIRILQKLRIR